MNNDYLMIIKLWIKLIFSKFHIILTHLQNLFYLSSIDRNVPKLQTACATSKYYPIYLKFLPDFFKNISTTMLGSKYEL